MIPRTMRCVAVALLLAVAGAPCGVRAQDARAVSADRPGFGDGSAVVAPGRVQVEAGYVYAGAESVDRHSLGQLAVRLGVVQGVELRALFNSYVLLRGDAEADGFEDVFVGAKVNLIEGTGTPLGVPALTLLAGAALPTGDDAFTNDEVVPEVKLALDLGLTPALAFSANAGYAFPLGGDLSDTFFTYASLGAAVPGAAGLGVFAGLYSLFPGDGDGSHGLDGGLTFLPDPAAQLDVNVGIGLSDSQPDLVLGAGVARRF